jgi:YD repeat-containing protein
MFHTLFWALFLNTAFFASEQDSEKIPLSPPEEIVTLSLKSDFLIQGLVSPLSGQLCLRQKDLEVKGAQKLCLERIYLPPFIPEHSKDQELYQLYQHLLGKYKGWVYFPHIKIQAFFPAEISYPSKEIMRETFKGTPTVRMNYKNGLSLEFKVDGKQVTLTSEPFGISNTCGDIPKRQFDPRNTSISIKKDRKTIKVITPEGIYRFYRLTQSHALPNRNISYHLEKEILKNGKVIRYYYENNKLISIRALNPKEDIVYARLDIQKEKDWKKFSSSSKDHVTYQYENRYFETEVKNNGRYYKLAGYFPPILKKVSSPFFHNEKMHTTQELLMDFSDNRTYPFKCSYSLQGKQGEKTYRLTELQLPVGEKDEYQSVCTMAYHPGIPGKKESRTTVCYWNGKKVVYRFNNKMLLKKIETYGANGDLQLQKQYHWYPNQWLKAIDYIDKNGQLFHKKHYEYDDFGNPILEAFSGDLSGEGKQECYAIYKTPSQDGKNLLLKKEEEEGKIFLYEYLPNTNLITAQFTQVEQKIYHRQFFMYDENHNLIKKIVDDGSSKNPADLSSVTQREVTDYKLRQKAPFLHMPEVIEEKYWEEGEEKLYKKKILTYDPKGNITQEDIYDAEKIFSYSIYREYNERGDLLSETDPLGKKTVYKYNKRGYCQQKKLPYNKLTIDRCLDVRGNLLQETHKGKQGDKTFSYKYDLQDHLIKKIDEYQNITKYTYDPVTHKITHTIYPKILSLEGEKTDVCIKASYDALGRKISSTDANGNTTFYAYNAREKITKILYSDGTSESFIYSKNGYLKQHLNQEGLKTLYDYDVWGNVIQKQFISEEREITRETFSYNIFHKLNETDREGNIRTYQYDGKGRTIENNKSQFSFY